MTVFDCETNGLIRPTKVHCISYWDKDKPKSLTKYSDMKFWLEDQPVLIGHNIIFYDIPQLSRLLEVDIKAKLYDTLAMSWVVNHDRNKHGLEEYGEDFGIPKPEVTDWENLTTEDYVHRCEEDVKINKQLWDNLIKELLLIYGHDKKALDRYLQYLTFKMQCAQSAESTGWAFNKDYCLESISKLEKLKQESIEELTKVMPKVPVYKKKTRPKVFHKKDGSLSAAAIRWLEVAKEDDEEVEYVDSYKEPNPTYHAEQKAWLLSLGWKPNEFKYNKKNEKIPQISKDGELSQSVEDLIEDHPEVKALEGLSVVSHRISVLENFIKYEEDGLLRAGISGFTNTLRFKHKNPLVNLPKPEKKYGNEIRGCLIAKPGHVLCGADMVSLESTTKRHYMYPYDPEYVEEMSKPGFDEHLDLAKHAGKIKQEDIEVYNKTGDKTIKKIRTKFKTTNYSAVYGVGKDKLARDMSVSVAEAKELLDAYWQRNHAVKKFVATCETKLVNGKMWVYNPVSKFWYSLRAEKDIFSTINQSTGVYCFDTWLWFYLQERPNIVGQFHDESANDVLEEEKEEHERTLRRAIDKTNDKLKLNVELDIDVKFGYDYSSIH